MNVGVQNNMMKLLNGFEVIYMKIGVPICNLFSRRFPTEIYMMIINDLTESYRNILQICTKLGVLVHMRVGSNYTSIHED